MRRCLRRNQPGPYQIQAAINAVHSDAARGRHRLGQIVALYDQLLVDRTRRPVVALHRAVAVAEVAGPAPALALVDELDARRLPPVPRGARRPAAPARPRAEAARRLRARRSS